MVFLLDAFDNEEHPIFLIGKLPTFVIQLVTMKRFTIASLLVGLAVIGCQKDNDQVSSPYVPDKFEDLRVPASFNWKLERKVTLTITGLQDMPAQTELDKTVKIYGEDGKLVMQLKHNISQSRTLELLLPTRYKNLEIHVGNFSKTVAIASNGTASFDFIVNTDHIN